MIKNIGLFTDVSPTGAVQGLNRSPIKQPEATKTDFSDVLKSAINHVNDLQVESDVKTELLASGQITDLHDVMITAQKASITIETAVQVQQKVIDMYNEVMRMQV